MSQKIVVNGTVFKVVRNLKRYVPPPDLLCDNCGCPVCDCHELPFDYDEAPDVDYPVYAYRNAS
jgi:hypothetical protein